MEPHIPPRTEIERRDERHRRWRAAAVLLALAVMAGTLSLIAFAYIEQSDEVDALNAQNEAILDEHEAIGKAFAQQRKKLEGQTKRLESALRSSYGQGFLAGREAARLPAALRPLARHASSGMSVPRRIPPSLSPKAPRIRAGIDGYEIRWSGLALFASRIDPLTVWTRQALAGPTRRMTLGGHRVRRLLGPNGVIYAWREDGSTYGLIAVPHLERVGRSLVRSTR
jgi:hypothetical protein